MAIDTDASLVQRYADRLTHTVQADATDEDALRQLGVFDFHRAVVAIGEHVEASVLTVSLLSEFGIRDIWAQAVSKQHARILQRVGANHAIAPEADMGVRVAHLVGGRMLDYIEFGEFAMSRTEVPREAWGKSLADAKFRSEVWRHRRRDQPAQGLLHVRAPGNRGEQGRHSGRRRDHRGARQVRSARLSPPQ